MTYLTRFFLCECYISCFIPTSYNLTTEGNQDGEAYTSVCLATLMIVLIILYHIHENTSLFARFYRTKFGKMLKKQFRSQFLKKHTEEHPSSISDDSIRRYDDILELSSSPAILQTNYHDADTTSIPQKPTFTSSELVINY